MNTEKEKSLEDVEDTEEVMIIMKNSEVEVVTEEEEGISTMKPLKKEI